MGGGAVLYWLFAVVWLVTAVGWIAVTVRVLRSGWHPSPLWVGVGALIVVLGVGLVWFGEAEVWV